MNKNLKQRVIEEATYIIETKKTIREVATYFNRSKSTVHKDLSERLQEYNKSLYKEVNNILQTNLATRHLRGGESTKKRYKKRR